MYENPIYKGKPITISKWLKQKVIHQYADLDGNAVTYIAEMVQAQDGNVYMFVTHEKRSHTFHLNGMITTSQPFNVEYRHVEQVPNAELAEIDAYFAAYQGVKYADLKPQIEASKESIRLVYERRANDAQ